MKEKWCLWSWLRSREHSWGNLLVKHWTCRDLTSFSSYLRQTKKPSDLLDGQDIYFFREGINPEWEDSANAHGGRWLLSLNRDSFETMTEVDMYWERLLVALVNNVIEGAEEITGATINSRRGARRIMIWLRNAHDDYLDLVLSIGYQLKDLMGLPFNSTLDFEPHNKELFPKFTPLYATDSTVPPNPSPTAAAAPPGTKSAGSKPPPPPGKPPSKKPPFSAKHPASSSKHRTTEQRRWTR
mmetsp:Transcript_37391/g.72424  ORF Transcript_37391/g.72424 Transcript_37391/m.72424 type:complete len:241 (-) Transcript_37391:87-809(-)